MESHIDLSVKPQKAHPFMVMHRMIYRLSKLIHWWDLCVWWRNKNK